jgi:hypothetical protein
LTIDDVPAHQIGYSCGTCDLVLAANPAHPPAACRSTRYAPDSPQDSLARDEDLLNLPDNLAKTGNTARFE